MINFITKVLSKYQIKLLFFIIFTEIKYVLSSFDFPLLDLRKGKNKDYHLSVSTPFIFMNSIKKIENRNSKSIFIDFGCGNGRVLKFLNNKNLFDFFFGYELKKEIVDTSIKNISLNINIKQKNLDEFSTNDDIFNFIDQNEINEIYLYFYNPFNINMVINIINIFKKFNKFHFYVLGFDSEDLKKIKLLEVNEINEFNLGSLKLFKYVKNKKIITR
jgi:hypothetical protein